MIQWTWEKGKYIWQGKDMSKGRLSLASLGSSQRAGLPFIAPHLEEVSPAFSVGTAESTSPLLFFRHFSSCTKG